MSKTQATVEGYELLSPTDVVRYLSKLPKELEEHISSIASMMNAVQSWERAHEVHDAILDVKQLLKRIAEETQIALNEMQMGIEMRHSELLKDLADKTKRLGGELGSRWNKHPMYGATDDSQLIELYDEVRQILADIETNFLEIVEWMGLYKRNKLPLLQKSTRKSSGYPGGNGWDSDKKLVFRYKGTVTNFEHGTIATMGETGDAKKTSRFNKTAGYFLWRLLAENYGESEPLPKEKILECLSEQAAEFHSLPRIIDNLTSKMSRVTDKKQKDISAEWLEKSEGALALKK